MPEDNDASKVRVKKKIIMIILAVVLLLAGVGGTFFFFFGNEMAPKEDILIQTDEPANLQAIYVSLIQPFLFNVTGDSQDRLVQVSVQLMVRGEDNEKRAKQNLPLLEHTLLNTFSASTVDQLRTARGKMDVRKQALDAVQAAMEKVTGKPVVERVLFTGFVMQ